MHDRETIDTLTELVAAQRQLLDARGVQLADAHAENERLKQRLHEAQAREAEGTAMTPQEWAAVEAACERYAFGHATQLRANLEHARGLKRRGAGAEEIITAIEAGGSPPHVRRVS